MTAAAGRSDAALAAGVAAEAGGLLVDLRASGDRTGPFLGRRGDRASNALIVSRLREERPGDAVLSEESEDDTVRLSSERVWIVDPLDGTREYGTPGRCDWAVHVALWEAGAGLTEGAVALPALGEVYSTESPRRSQPPSGERHRPLVLVSDTRPPAFAEDVAAMIGADVQPMGSAGAKAMAVLKGEADAYLHAGGQWEWDSAAPVAVGAASGLHASRIDGSPLVYNQPHPYLPDLVISRVELAMPLLAAIASILG